MGYIGFKKAGYGVFFLMLFVYEGVGLGVWGFWSDGMVRCVTGSVN